MKPQAQNEQLCLNYVSTFYPNAINFDSPEATLQLTGQFTQEELLTKFDEAWSILQQNVSQPISQLKLKIARAKVWISYQALAVEKDTKYFVDVKSNKSELLESDLVEMNDATEENEILETEFNVICHLLARLYDVND